VIAALGLDGYPVVLTGEAPEPDAKHPDSLAGVRGAHVYLRGNLPTTDTKIAGVEIRGAGAYVLVPPSVHPSGVPYEGDVPPMASVPASPDWLESAMRPAASSVEVPGDDDVVTQGGRHEALLAWARSRYAAKGVLGTAMLDGMRGHNARAMDPSLEVSRAGFRGDWVCWFPSIK